MRFGKCILGIVILQFILPALWAQGQDSIAWSLVLDEMVVTAQLKPTHYKNAIHKVEVIDRTQIESRAALSLEEVLLTSSSIRLHQDPILGTQIQMRGMDAANVAILIDGVPVIGRLDGAIDISQLPTFNIERIEIVEGPMSNIYGSNAAGGVINIITQKAKSEQLSFQLRHLQESIGARNTEASLAFRQKQFWLQLSGRIFDFQQYPIDSMRVIEKITNPDSSSFIQSRYPWNPKEQFNAAAKMGTHWGSQNEYAITLGAQWNGEEVKDYGPIRRPQFRPYAQDQFFQTQRLSLDATFLAKGAQGTQLEWTLAANRFDRTRTEKRYYLESLEYDSLLQQSDQTLLDNYFSRVHLTGSWGDRIKWGAGGTLNHEWGRGGRILDLSRTDSLSAVMTELGLYNQWDIELAQGLELSASFRWNIHSEYTPQWTPSIQIKYDIDKNWKARASFAQGYRNPSLKERYIEFIDINHHILGGPDLTSEKTRDIQLSLDYIHKDWEASIGAFSTRIYDRIQLVEFETLKYRYQNIDTYETFGLQLDGSWKNEQWELQTAVNWTFVELSVENGTQEIQAPVWDFNQQLNYREPFSQILCSANYRMQGNTPAFRDLDGELVTIQFPAIHLLDLSLTKTFWQDHIQLQTGIKNILGITAMNIPVSGGSAHSGGGRRMVDQGRSYFVSLGLQF